MHKFELESPSEMKLSFVDQFRELNKQLITVKTLLPGQMIERGH